MKIKRFEYDHSVQFKLANVGYHRTNGPAYINKLNLATYWWLHNEIHRYYGPYSSRNGYWAIHGKNIK